MYETKYPNLNCSLLADGVEGLSEVSEAHVDIAVNIDKVNDGVAGILS